MQRIVEIMKANTGILMKGFIVLMILISYFTLIPVSNKVVYLEKYDYTIKLQNVDKSNTAASFRNGKTKGNFFIHPGALKETIGIFTFKSAFKANFYFSLNKGAKDGNIKFTILKNDINYGTFVIDSEKNKKHNVGMFIDVNDKVEVRAYHNGSTAYDWGSLEVHKTGLIDTYQQAVIPVLWIMLFFFLLKYGFVAAGIITYIMYFISLYAEVLNFGSLSFELSMAYLSLFFLITLIYIILHQLFSKYMFRKLKAFTFFGSLSSFVLYILPLSMILYVFVFEVKVTKDILYAVFQTNNDESLEFISHFISLKYLLYVSALILTITFLFYKEENVKKIVIDKYILIFSFVLLSSLSIAQFHSMRVPQFIAESFKQYIEEVHFFEEEQNRRKMNAIKFKASKKSQSETYVVVIGESLNKYHMGVYGYSRKTTPELSALYAKGDLLRFDNVYSNHTVTTHTLSYALTEANQYNAKKYYNSISIVELLNKANFETYWLTGQGKFGAFQNLISVVASAADEFVSIDTFNGNEKFDGLLLPKIKSILNTKTSKNRVIFVHLAGNHYTYKERYPNEFSQYKKNTSIDTYDNSVLYNDYIVSSIIEELKKINGVNGFLYFSDHGEDVKSGKSHNPTMFTFEMVYIPMLARFSDEYQVKYKNKYDNLLKRKDMLFSNDMIYDTIIGMTGIDTEKYNKVYDFTSNHYKLKEEEALTLHGSKKYLDKTNYRYWNKAK